MPWVESQPLGCGVRRRPGKPGGGVFYVSDSGGKGKFRENTYEAVKAKTYDIFWVELLDSAASKG